MVHYLRLTPPLLRINVCLQVLSRILWLHVICSHVTQWLNCIVSDVGASFLKYREEYVD